MTMACALSALDDLYRTRVSSLEDSLLLLQSKNSRLEQYREEFIKLQVENKQLASALSRANKQRLNRCDACSEKQRVSELQIMKETCLDEFLMLQKVKGRSVVNSKLSSAFYGEKIRRFIPFL